MQLELLPRGLHIITHQVGIDMPDYIYILTPLMSRCHQLFVNYTRIPFSEWERNPRDLDTVNWDVSYTKFLINSEGCGYPPTTNCSIFARQYG